MDEILNHILPTNAKVIKYGQSDEKVMLEIKMNTSLYVYIDIIHDYYDNEEVPYFNNWTDIEGMGYGWRWMNHEEKDWHKMMSNMVSQVTDVLIKDADNTLYFVYMDGTVKTYHFVYLESHNYRKDTIVRLSNEELYW